VLSADSGARATGGRRPLTCARVRLWRKKQAMRIVHLIDYLAASDGHAAVCLRLAAEQARRGHACTIVTCRMRRDDVAQLQPSGVALHVLDSRRMPFRGGRLMWPKRGAIAALFHDFRPDVIHLHGFWDCTILCAASAARRAGLPAVLSPHGVLAPWVLQRRRFLKRLVWGLHVRGCLRGLDALHAASASEADHLRDWGFRQPIAVIPPGVDLPASSPLAGAGAPDAQGQGADALRIALFLSRLHPLKGLPLLLRAWSAVRPAGWRLVIAGPGSAREIAELQALCATLNVTSDVQLVGEARGAARELLYRGADLFVLPSHTENFGLVVAEALACGLPVITTRGTPWSELVARECGWWVEAAVPAISGALREATQLPDEARRAMGARGRALVRERYTWDACVEKMLAMYGRLAPRSSTQ